MMNSSFLLVFVSFEDWPVSVLAKKVNLIFIFPYRDNLSLHIVQGEIEALLYTHLFEIFSLL